MMSDARTCNEVRSLMADWLDGELSATLKVRVDGHLAECTDCRAAFSRMQALGGELSMLGGAADRIAENAVTFTGRSTYWRRSWVRAAAIVVLVVAGIYFAGTRLPVHHPEILVERKTPGDRIDVRPAPNETVIVPEAECRAEGRTAVAIASANPRVRIVWLYEDSGIPVGSTESSGGPKPRPQS